MFISLCVQKSWAQDSVRVYDWHHAYNVFLICFCLSQSCPFYVICWVQAVMRWWQEMQPFAWLTALSWRELPATCWALILCCYFYATLQGTLRGKLWNKMQPSLLLGCVDLSPGALSPSLNHMLLITYDKQASKRIKGHWHDMVDRWHEMV